MKRSVERILTTHVGSLPRPNHLVVDDAKFGKAMRRSMDFGPVYDRLAGFDLREEQAGKDRAAWTFGIKKRKGAKLATKELWS